MKPANYGNYLKFDPSIQYTAAINDYHYAVPYDVGYDSSAYFGSYIPVCESSNRTSWYVMAANCQSFDYGSPKIGQNVKSGDTVMLSAGDPSAGVYGFINIIWGWTGVYWGYTNTLAIVSSPASTYGYCYLSARNQVFSGCFNIFRIYKRGGTVGSTISPTDNVYFVHYATRYDYANRLNQNRWNDNTFWEKGYHYLGSSNQNYSTAKEIYTYHYASSGQPSNLDTNLLWNIETIHDGAYISAPSAFYYGTPANADLTITCINATISSWTPVAWAQH